MNVKIFERFRAACDEFFKRKAEFFKSIKESMAGNLEKKKALCEKAEALKESTDWKATADILSKLQRNGKQSVLYLKVFGCRMETIHCRM